MASKTLKTALDLAQGGNPTRFGEVITQVINDKVLDHLQDLRQEVAKDILKYEPAIGDDDQQEALEPRAPGERKFKALHSIQRRAAVGQTDFNGGSGKTGKRDADQDTGDDSGEREDPSSTVARLRDLATRPAGMVATEEVELDEKNWIAKAIKHPGAMTAAAKREGLSNSEYEQKHKHDKGKAGNRARLALTLGKLNK